ncbi:MAG TPA: bifunctional methylenetetrahydrofolate dehydrogenase/methenyltetrahydrofolate cyclohydrolase FolD [Bryobacteraceae bacterium]|nr:bifunctional methylenetetrahydrofolate dehydrogenase/methenyltetrahydrofolate cyclohydrolase FolD [Bryobacteraceae bacterium]
MAQILDGTFIRDQILEEIRPRVEALAAAGMRPGIAVVLAGHNPASEIYVRNKVKASESLGIRSETYTPAELVTTAEMLALVDELNHKPDIHGILVQLPLPPQLDAKRILFAVAPDKDVDGFHPLNLGKLVVNTPGPRSCTPAGIMELLKRYGIPISGKNAVVVGRSDIVGKPMALMLLNENATVTICHSKTSNLPEVCRRADILVAAIGRGGMVTADYIKPGATVIDVGMNRLTTREQVEKVFRGDPARIATFERRGSLLIGDVNPIDMATVSGAYTPVPGGVGPLTIAMLMANTVEAAARRRAACSE